MVKNSLAFHFDLKKVHCLAKTYEFKAVVVKNSLAPVLDVIFVWPKLSDLTSRTEASTFHLQICQNGKRNLLFFTGAHLDAHSKTFKYIKTDNDLCIKMYFFKWMSPSYNLQHRKTHRMLLSSLRFFLCLNGPSHIMKNPDPTVSVLNSFKTGQFPS